MITWPSLFPAPSVSYGIAVNTSVARTKMESGRTRQRKRFSRDFRQMSVNWELSDYEYGLFQNVYKHVLNSGADWFEMSLPLGDSFKTYKVRFVADSYSAKYDSVMYWKISAKLETEDQPEPYDSETINALVLIDFDLDGLESSSDSLHVLVNETLPNNF